MQAKISSYVPAWWLPGPHLQATWANMLRSLNRLPHRREFIDAPDGDFVVLDILLNWLGRSEKPEELAAAATLSVPYDLGAGVDYLHSGIRWLYVQSFLKSLKPKALGIIDRFPHIQDLVKKETIAGARTGFDFD